MTDPAIIKAGARALEDKLSSVTFAGRTHLMPLSLDNVADIVITAAAPLLRAAALEEAAKVAEEYPEYPGEVGMGDQIAAAIRALVQAESSAA